jgi:hypothetical protein
MVTICRPPGPPVFVFETASVLAPTRNPLPPGTTKLRIWTQGAPPLSVAEGMGVPFRMISQVSSQFQVPAIPVDGVTAERENVVV